MRLFLYAAALVLGIRPAAGQDLPPAQRGAFLCAEQKQALARRVLPAPVRASAASANFDATFYHLALDVRFDPPYLYGRARVAGRVRDAPLATLRLDFGGAMQVDAVRTPGGTPLPFAHANDVLAIDLPESAAPGTLVTVDVDYQGLPPQADDGPFAFGTHPSGAPLAWTLSEPYGARAWWPCKDHPSDKADSVHVSVTVPAALRVGSNGLLQAETDHGDGTTTYAWRTRYPIAPYLVSLAAGPYDVYEQVYQRPDSLAARYGALALPVLHYAYQGSTLYEGTGATTGWRHVLDVLPVLEHWFGPYPFPEEKYGHAQFTWRGGMEHQTMSSMGGSSIGLVTHELAHMWFGDLITMRFWPHLWLNEGFATYAELLYYEQARQDAVAALYDVVFDLYWDRAREAEGTLIVQDTTSVADLFDGARVYAKGAMVLHMLRTVTGDAAFRDVLQAYAAAPVLRYGTATTADFQAVAEAVSGQDLGAFFRQWVTEGTGYPVYLARWSAAPDGDRYAVTVEVEQTQAPPLSNVPVFVMPVTLAVQTTAGPRRFVVQNDRRRQTYYLTVDALPTGLAFDPDRRLLRNASVPISTGVEDPAPTPAHGLLDAFPSPADGVLHVRFALATPGPAPFALYDALGRRVRVVEGRALPAGAHEATFDVSTLPAGRYFLRLETPAGHDTRAVSIVR